MSACHVSSRIMRSELRAALHLLSRQEIHDRSLQACNRLTEQPEYQRSEIVLVFLSSANEIDTASLVLHAWQCNKRVLAPQFSWEQRRLMPVEIRSLTERPDGLSSLGQPVQGVPVPVDMIDVAIVPGLGFDLGGRRMGRGQGVYDRLLGSAAFRGVACALAFEEQVVRSLPSRPQQICLDMLVTDACVRRFG